MKRRLRVKKVDEISFVDGGDNPAAVVTLQKHEPPAQPLSVLGAIRALGELLSGDDAGGVRASRP